MRDLLVMFLWGCLAVPAVGDVPTEPVADAPRAGWTSRQARGAADPAPDEEVFSEAGEPQTSPSGAAVGLRPASYEEDVSPGPEEIATPDNGGPVGAPAEVPAMPDEGGPVGAPAEVFAAPDEQVPSPDYFNGYPAYPEGGQTYGFGQRVGIWARGEYLLWWTKGMDLPPLVTTSPPGTPPNEAGVLGFEDTEILFGNSTILDDDRAGARIILGAWLDPCGQFGVEGYFLGLGEDSQEFRATSDANGNPILARPFFNMNPRDPTTGAMDPPAREDSELVSYPGRLAGTVVVNALTRFHSAGMRFHINLRREDPCSSACGGGSSFDFLVGPRYMRLKDRLAIAENLTALDDNSTFAIVDSFDTRTTFQGAEVGVLWEARRNRWSLEALGTLALGNSHEVVDIDGSTIITPFPGGPATPFSGGLLAQRTNMGSYARDEFAVVPEVGVTLGYQLTCRLRLTVGYSLIYWSRVVRAGDQIDLDLNPDLLPPEMEPFEGPLRPRFAFHSTDFWAQGLSLGLDYRW